MKNYIHVWCAADLRRHATDERSLGEIIARESVAQNRNRVAQSLLVALIALNHYRIFGREKARGVQTANQKYVH